MENRQTRFIEEEEYAEFAWKFLELTGEHSRLDYLNSIFYLYETNKNMFKKLIEELNYFNSILYEEIQNEVKKQLRNDSTLVLHEVRKNVVNTFRSSYLNKGKGFTVSEIYDLIDLITDFESSKADAIRYQQILLLKIVHNTRNTNIDDVLESNTKNFHYPILKENVSQAAKNHKAFLSELKVKLNKENWQIIEIDLINDFLPIVEEFLGWYNEQNEKVKEHKSENLYSTIYFCMKFMIDTINKYFPLSESKLKCFPQIANYIEKSIPNYSPPAAPESLSSGADEEKKSNEVNNQFNSMPIERVKNHFMQLVLAKNKINQPFLSKENLEIFIQKCLVEDKKLETKLKLNFYHGEKGFIINVFHKFYTDSQVEYENSNSVDKYVQLLADNFEQFVFEKIKPNFHKYKEKELKV